MTRLERLEQKITALETLVEHLRNRLAAVEVRNQRIGPPYPPLKPVSPIGNPYVRTGPPVDPPKFDRFNEPLVDDLRQDTP